MSSMKHHQENISYQDNGEESRLESNLFYWTKIKKCHKEDMAINVAQLLCLRIYTRNIFNQGFVSTQLFKH